MESLELSVCAMLNSEDQDSRVVFETFVRGALRADASVPLDQCYKLSLS